MESSAFFVVLSVSIIIAFAYREWRRNRDLAEDLNSRLGGIESKLDLLASDVTNLVRDVEVTATRERGGRFVEDFEMDDRNV